MTWPARTTDGYPRTHDALVRDLDANGHPVFLGFSDPVCILSTCNLDEVPEVLAQVERAASEGFYAVGFVSYEAAPSFDRALETHPPNALPLIWFGVYENPTVLDKLPSTNAPPPLEWKPTETALEHHDQIVRIKHSIAEGEVYQVNHTFLMSATYEGSLWPLFVAAYEQQKSWTPAFIQEEQWSIASLSPELFFELDDTLITTRPMKGTRPRGRTTLEDLRQARALLESEKERAENLMIVDMLRNDLGRIAETGSIEVSSLYDIERYPTVLQMTSSVKARTQATLADIFKALFPCASITGAPKISAMKKIRSLEPHARGVYTGAIGLLRPGRSARFNVGIRTLSMNHETHMITYGTGGGIVWDSEPAKEYAECLTKTNILSKRLPSFELLETMRWDTDNGYFLLNEHLDRLMDSAFYFGLSLNREALISVLKQSALDSESPIERVRLLVNRHGELSIERHPCTLDKSIWKIALSTTPIDVHTPFVFHKTTARSLYEAHLETYPEADDVLLQNEKGELTESCYANIVVELDGKLYTPPLECGLLNGTMRKKQLAEKTIKERILRTDDLKRATRILLINSVHEWMRTEWCQSL